MKSSMVLYLPPLLFHQCFWIWETSQETETEIRYRQERGIEERWRREERKGKQNDRTCFCSCPFHSSLLSDLIFPPSFFHQKERKFPFLPLLYKNVFFVFFTLSLTRHFSSPPFESLSFSRVSHNQVTGALN